MDEKLVHKKKVIRYKHMLLGIVILLCGIFLGFVGGIYMVGEYFDYFRPRPKDIKEEMSQRILTDFPSLKNQKPELEQILDTEFKNFGKLNEEISYRILQMQQKIAVNIADMIKADKDKARWMQTFPEYFPGHKHRLNRARKFEKRHHKHMHKSSILEDWERPPPPPDF